MVGLYIQPNRNTLWSDDIPFEALRRAVSGEVVREVALSDFVKGRIFQTKWARAELHELLQEYDLA